jgi:hypothetical protein
MASARIRGMLVILTSILIVCFAYPQPHTSVEAVTSVNSDSIRNTVDSLAVESVDNLVVIGPNIVQRFHNLLQSIDSDTSCTNLASLEAMLNKVFSSNLAYIFYDIALYYSGVYAHLCGEFERSISLYETYLKRRSLDDSESSFPHFVFENEGVRRLRKTGVSMQERVSKMWKEDRWAFHLFKPDQRGFEYKCILLNLAQIYYLNENLHLENFKSIRSKLQKDDIPSKSNLAATIDLSIFAEALVHIRRDKKEEALALIKSLETSTSLYPISPRLLNNIKDGPAVVSGFRVSALLTFLVIISIGTLILLFLFHTAKRRKLRDSMYKYKRYLIHTGDPLMHTVIDRLHLKGIHFLILSTIVLAMSQSWLAWSEDALRRNSFVVDRSFLDYYSFPFGLALIIPILLAATVFFYRYVPKQFKTLFEKGIFSRTGDSKEDVEDTSALHSILSGYLRFCNSRTLSGLTLVAALAIMLGQKVVWINDGGTAFVDLWYPRHFSLTALYFTISSILVYYAVIGVFLRGGATLIVISKVFSSRTENLYGFEPNYSIDHPDGCCGTRSLGLILVVFYFLLLLLGAQLVLNLVEKLNFYESMDIVLDQTIISVLLFGVTLFGVCPGIVAAPLLSMHMSMRRYRYSRLLNLSKTLEQLEGHASNIAKKETGLPEEHSLAVDLYNRLSEKVGKMPLWPIDTRMVGYIAASNLLPVITFFMPFILISLGIDAE